MVYIYELLQFVNCRILRDHRIINEDLWVRDGKILDPMQVFFDEKKMSSVRIDCNNAVIAPGFIDIQINGEYTIYIFEMRVFLLSAFLFVMITILTKTIINLTLLSMYMVLSNNKIYFCLLSL